MVSKESLYAEYLKRVINKEDELPFKDALRLVQAYENEFLINKQHSLMDINKKHFVDKPSNYVNYMLFKARRYFLRKYGYKPKETIHNVNKRFLLKDQIIYDEDYKPHVWDGEKFWKIKFFD